MIIERLYSRTWTEIKDKGERTKKAKSLLKERKEINKRRDAIKKERAEGLKGSAMGTNQKFVRDKAGKVIKDAAGNSWTNPVTAEEVESRFRSQIKDLNAYTNSILDKKHTSKSKSTVEKIKEKGSEILKNPKTKKLGKAALITAGGAITIGGGVKGTKKVMDKKKENKTKNKILGKKK